MFSPAGYFTSSSSCSSWLANPVVVIVAYTRRSHQQELQRIFAVNREREWGSLSLSPNESSQRGWEPERRCLAKARDGRRHIQATPLPTIPYDHDCCSHLFYSFWFVVVAPCSSSSSLVITALSTGGGRTFHTPIFWASS